MAKLTDSQHKAIRWLYNAGGDGSIQKGGVVLCGGQRGRFLPETWLRLVTLQMIESHAPYRLRLTDQARAYCQKNFGQPDVMKTSFEDNACDDEDEAA